MRAGHRHLPLAERGLPDHRGRAGRLAGRRGSGPAAAVPGRRGGACGLRVVAAGGPRLRPGLRRHRVALGRPGRALPAGPRGAPARRLPRLLAGSTRHPRRRATRSSPRSRRCTTRSARACPTTTSLRHRASCPTEAEEIEASGLFVVSEVRHFDWSVSYDADSYLALLDTFSGHIAMEPAKREHLYAEIRRRLAAATRRPPRAPLGRRPARRPRSSTGRAPD